MLTNLIFPRPQMWLNQLDIFPLWGRPNEFIFIITLKCKIKSILTKKRVLVLKRIKTEHETDSFSLSHLFCDSCYSENGRCELGTRSELRGEIWSPLGKQQFIYKNFNFLPTHFVGYSCNISL